MPSAPSFTLRFAPRPRPHQAATAGLTLVAVIAVLALSGKGESASVWRILIDFFPNSAPSAFALSWASMTGCVAGLIAEAAGRRAFRPALLAAVAVGLLSPAALDVPLWPCLLAAAALLATPTQALPKPANDNPIPAHRTRHPVSLAA